MFLKPVTLKPTTKVKAMVKLFKYPELGVIR